MQSDGNSICGYDVLVSFNISYRDEDSIQDKKYEKQIYLDPYYEDLKFLKWFTKMHIERHSAHNNK